MLIRTRRVVMAAAAATTLALTAAPAIADPAPGTIEVTFAYDTGAPVTVLASFTDAAGTSPGQTLATSSHSESRTGGTTYGAVLVGGWGGITCVRLAPCSWLSIQGNPMAARPTPDAPVLGDGGSATISESRYVPAWTPSTTRPTSIARPPAVVTTIACMAARRPALRSA